MTEPAHRWGPWQEYRHNDQWIRLAPPPWKAVAQSGGDVALPGAVELNRLDEEPPGRMQGHSPFPATRPEIRRCPRRPGRRYGQHVRWRLRCRCHPRRHATARFRWADRHPLRFSWRRPADGGVMEPGSRASDTRANSRPDETPWQGPTPGACILDSGFARHEVGPV